MDNADKLANCELFNGGRCLHQHRYDLFTTLHAVGVTKAILKAEHHAARGNQVWNLEYRRQYGARTTHKVFTRPSVVSAARPSVKAPKRATIYREPALQQEL